MEMLLLFLLSCVPHGYAQSSGDMFRTGKISSSCFLVTYMHVITNPCNASFSVWFPKSDNHIGSSVFRVTSRV